MTIQMGSRGPEVKGLQLKLKAAGFNPGDIDGIFGKHTLAALKHFQETYEELADTGVFDAETAAALDQALVVRDSESPGHTEDPEPAPCAPEIWTAFKQLVDLVTTTPIRYGPGRGLFKDGKFIISYGPGSLGSKSWRNHLGNSYPSFHCTSWTNFFLGWLLRYNQDYTHAGNIPSLFALLEQSNDVHQQPDGGPYRGYGPHVREIVSNGATALRSSTTSPRTTVPTGIDIRELHDRRASLPTFLICGQSTHTVKGWKRWHHTLLFAIDHRAAGSPMYRIAADGYRDANGYSGQAMQWIEIDKNTLSKFQSAIYRVYGVKSTDGTYGGDRPIPKVELEP